MIPSNPLYDVSASNMAAALAALAMLACIVLVYSKYELSRNRQFAIYSVPLFLAYASGRLFSAEASRLDSTLYEITPWGDTAANGEPHFGYLDWQGPGEMVNVGLGALLCVSLYGVHRLIKRRQAFAAGTVALFSVALAGVFVATLMLAPNLDRSASYTLATIEGFLLDILFVGVPVHLVATLVLGGRMAYGKYRGAKVVPNASLPVQRPASE